MLQRIRENLSRRRTRKDMVKKGFIAPRGSLRKTGDSVFAAAADRSLVLGCFMLVLLWGTCSLLLTLSSSQYQKLGMLVIDQVAPETINAEFDFTYEDAEATRLARQAARDAEPVFFRLSESADTRIKANFKAFFAAVEYRSAPNSPESRRPDPETLPAKLAASLTPEELKALSQCTRDASAHRYFENELNTLLAGGILGSPIKSVMQIGQKIRIIDAYSRERRPRLVSEQPSEDEAAQRLAVALLKFYPAGAEHGKLFRTFANDSRLLLGDAGNMVEDTARTEAGRLEAERKIGRINAEIKRHTPVIRKGEVVTDSALSRLRLYAERCAGAFAERDWKRPLINMFWSLALVVFAGFYLYHIHPEVVQSNRRIGIVGSAMLISLVVNYGGIELFNWMASQSSELSASLVIDAVPLALIAVLMAAFLGYRVAMCTGFFVASVTALMLDLSFEFALKGLVICSLSALAVRNATNYRSFFMRTVFSVFPLVWLLNFNLLFGMHSDWQAALRMFFQSGALAFGNALATAVLAQILIFGYEILLNVTTNMSLMLLCDYNHPLLERMKREAPGTFFHSLMVATLAEDAAGAIGANPLRAKAGALYHDIGKLSKPQYFTENNRDGNFHANLTPQMSSIIIRDHVKEGLALAREYKLARVVREAIEQHHGSDLVYYFFRKAQELAKAAGDTVQESQFRYPGPPPRSKETAIISLADACEAACRSLDKPSATRIEAQVDEIFLKRFRDGQLADAEMTLAELEKVRESFINSLMSMKHGRIAYQPEEEKEEEDEDDLFVAARKNGARES